MGSITPSDRFADVVRQTIETGLFINGEFVQSKAGKTFDVVNPATEKVVASVYEADSDDVDAAVAAAKAAFPVWSELSATERQGWLLKLADALEKRSAEISWLEAVSVGKPAYSDCRSVRSRVIVLLY